jgi:seryl-tRNA synthetase
METLAVCNAMNKMPNTAPAMLDDDQDFGTSTLEFGARLDEENRKAIAQYAYQVERRIRDIRFRDERMVVRMRDGAALDGDMRKLILGWADKLAAESPSFETHVLRERTAARLVGGTPLRDFHRSGLLMQQGPGLVGWRGEALAFRRALDATLRTEAIARGAVEHEYPPLLELEALAESGYIGNFPQHVFFLSEVDRDAEAVERVRAATGSVAKAPENVDRALTTSPLVMSPTICYHCFRLHRGQTLSATQGLFTAVGQCGRKEPFVGPDDRLQLFTMREIIAFGSAKEVDAERNHWMDFAWNLVTRLELTARIVAAFDPFFVFANKLKAYQRLLKAKYELQVKLPEEERWCAVASFNHHGTALTRAFRMKRGSAPLQSGCVGFGYERFVVSVVAQRGPVLPELEAALAGA